MYIGTALRLTRTDTLSPALALELRASALDPRLTFSRASAATDIINGVLTAFANDAPRISLANGLLLEEARTNLAPNANLVGLSGMTLTAQPDPLGGLQAVLASEDSNATFHAVGTATVLPVASTVYMASCFARAGTLDRVQLAVSGSYAATDVYANFQLAGAGSITASGAGVADVRIEPLANGWYRLSFRFTTSASVAAGSGPLLASLRSGSETRLPTVTGLITNNFYFWGVQLEAGAFLTTYIPTTSSAATRAVENCSMALASWFNSDEGTFWLEAQAGYGLDAAASTQPRLLRVDNGGNTMVHEIRRNTSDATSRMGTTTSNTTQSALVTGAWPALAVLRTAYAYRANDMAGCLNGGTVQTDSTSPDGMPTGLTTLRVGGLAGAGAFGGYIRSLRYWRTRLGNTQIKAMTT